MPSGEDETGAEAEARGGTERPRAARHRWASTVAALAAIALVAALACEGSTSILLWIDGDLRPGDDADRLAVRIAAEGEELWQTSVPFTAEAGLPQSLRIVPGEETPRAIDVQVSALLGDADVVVASRALELAPGRSTEHRICLWRRCIGSDEPGCLEGECGAPATDGDADVDGDSDADEDGDGDADEDEDRDGDVDADADPDGDQCEEGLVACEGDTLVRCEGGSWGTVETCDLGCDDALGRCLLVDPGNVSEALLDDHAAVDVVVDGTVTVDTDTCDPSVFGTPAPYAEYVDVTGAVDLCVVVMSSLTVAATGSIEATGGNALVLLAAGDVLVDGTISVGATGHLAPGAGGRRGGDPDEGAPSSSGCGGGAGTEFIGTSVPRNSGGGGGGHGGQGGRGGDALEDTPGGTAGLPRGGELLEPLTGGCGGGGGASETGAGTGGRGGGGGGALQITAGGLIHVSLTGRIVADGGGGQGGGSVAGGGGGGAGGGVLLEAAEVTVEGVVAANGGGGGSAGGFTDSNDGSDGSDDDSRAPGGASPSANSERGGSGGAGSDADGETPPTESNTGGGGGAAGRVRINTRSGSAAIPGLVSPSTTGTLTEGTVGTR